MSSSYRVSPLSRAEIRRLAHYLRRITNTEKDVYLDIMKVLELDMPRLIDGFEFEVVSEEKLQNECGITIPAQRKIILNEWIYNAAHAGDGYARFSAAHELGHLLIHDQNAISMCRLRKGGIKTYEDPEWQADAFAGEFLMYYPLVNGMTPLEIEINCGVSKSAARTQFSKF